MKYSEGFSGSKPKLGTGFYIVIACCLLIIGGASWFALSKYADEGTVPQNTENSEYTDKTPSYTESVKDEAPNSTESTPAEDVAESVTDQPYSSEKETTEAKPQSNTFTMPVEGEIIKEHSTDRLQYSATYGDMRLHNGIDIACNEGTAVSACADGTVLSVATDAVLGNVVVIDHGNGITVKYASLNDVEVKQGGKVKLGDIIGTVGTVPEECSDKSHLHLEVLKNDVSVEPLKALGLE
ncbi:MAG: peptidoglycan DD-metalloendopeptidase family protein [Clostridia bacterium]|nr:peptidoglycan DD-metalloendopeptidase family protein [Clostridia bacterium]